MLEPFGTPLLKSVNVNVLVTAKMENMASLRQVSRDRLFVTGWPQALENLEILEKGIILEIDLEKPENMVFNLPFLENRESVFSLSLLSFLCANSVLLV